MKGRRIGRYDRRRGTGRPGIALATTAVALLFTASQTTASTAATTTTGAATAACRIDAGAVSSVGDHRSQEYVATTPATLAHDVYRARGVFAPGQVRLSTEFQVRRATGYQVMSGHVVLGSGLYQVSYPVFDGESRPYEVHPYRVGGGWDRFVALTTSRRVASEPANATERLYGLRADGALYRWTIASGPNPTYRAASFPGFGAVKTMTLLSRTATYDTLLITTRSGSLQTVRIPLTAPIRPTLQPVRNSTWQGFEALMASRCGQYGTLLLGIDKDTGTGYLYAVGHANGPDTVIKSIGKVPGTLGDPVAFRWASYTGQPLFGE